MRRPVDLFHLHAGIADNFHHGGQRYQNFVLQPMKWINSVLRPDFISKLQLRLTSPWFISSYGAM